MAVTALSAVTIERQGLTGLTDITKAAPSVSITQSAGGGRNAPLFTIRGQRQGDTLASVDPSVGVYIGDQLFKRTYGLDQVTFDMSSIQVLKGPQGTLFGLNTTGGNIIFQPAQPTNRFEGSVKVGIGNFNAKTIEGFVNLPLADGVALRLSGRYQKRDGYIKNVTTGQDSQDINGGGIRAILKLTPNDVFETTTTASYMTSDTNGTGWKLYGLQATNQAGTAPTSLYSGIGWSPAQLDGALARAQALGYYETNQNRTGIYAKTNPAWNISNTTVYKLSDSLTIKNIIGTRKYVTSYADDLDGSDLAILEYGNRQAGKEFSEEFQLLGTGPTRNWIIGAYYSSEEVDSYAYTITLVSPKLFGIQTPYKSSELAVNTGKSIFASATQKLDGLLNGLSLTLGGRYTWDERRAKYGTVYNYGVAPGTTTGFGSPSKGQYCGFSVTDPNMMKPVLNFSPATCMVDTTKNFEKFTYTASLDWKFAPNKLVYVSTRKGYRAGGFGTRATTAGQVLSSFAGDGTLAFFRPEVVKDIELGTKLDFKFDNGVFLRTNLAVYDQKYTDIQRLVPFTTPTGGISTNVMNAAKATIKGYEAEFVFRPTSWLDLSGSYSRTEPEYGQFISGGVDVAKVATFAGVPKDQMSLTARANLPTSGNLGQAAIQLGYYKQTSFYGQDSTDTQPLGLTPGYDIMNARFELNDIAGKPLNLAIFVNNLGNKKYLQFNYALQYSVGFASSLAAPPRMYGIELRYDW